MNKYSKITSLQYGMAIYFIMRSMSLGISINSYIHIGGVDGYLSPIIGMIIGFIPIYIFIKIFNYEPELNIFEKVNHLFGKKGIIINIIMTLTAYFLATIVFWNLINFIVSQYLFKTKTIAVAILFGILFIYATSKSINTIFRTINLLFYISIIIFIICLLGLINVIKLNNFLPFLEYGISKPLLSSLSHVAYSVLPLFILLLVPKKDISNNENINKYIIISYILSSLTKTFVIFSTIGIFGIDLASLYEFPDFLVLSRMSTSGFFQRLESILSIQWIFDSFVMICICLQFIKKAYKHTITNKYKDLFMVINISILCIICSNYLFKNNTVGDLFILYKLPFILVILYIVPLIIFFKIKKT